MNLAPNRLFFSGLLPVRFPQLWAGLQQALVGQPLQPELLPHTRDIWAVDYMPVQVSGCEFVQFRYEPGYLVPFAKHRPTITNAADTGLSEQLPCLINSTLRLDGGNMVRAGGLVLVGDRVLAENPTVPETHLRRQLADELQAERLLLLPTAPGDIIGHADGMVQLLDERTVLVNDYHGPETAFGQSLRRELRNAGLECVPFPYNPFANRSSLSAVGVYLNFLRLPGLVLLPGFGLAEDETARQVATSLFPDNQIVPLDCTEVAARGGAVHCLAWAWHDFSL